MTKKNKKEIINKDNMERDYIFYFPIFNILKMHKSISFGEINLISP
jgi:hypothetical protein